MQITGGARYRKIVFPTSHYELPFDSPWTDARWVGDDRSRSRWHNAQWLPSRSFRRAIRIGVRFYGSMVLSSEFRQQRSVPPFSSLPLSLSLACYLSVSVSSFTPSHLSSPSRCRTRHYVTIVPWNWTSFMYRMSMTLSRRAPHITIEHAKSTPAPLWKT